jgi:hypothetical protein
MYVSFELDYNLRFFFILKKEDQDPRRLTFYLNYFLDLTHRLFINNVENNDKFLEHESARSVSSFQQTNCLHLLKAMRQCEWKAPQFWSSLLEKFLSNMSHPYKAVREKVVSVSNLFISFKMFFFIKKAFYFICHILLKECGSLFNS